ncbi:MAG: HAMP domain-containing histidine kinase [Ignavibacteriales bacterium]|nr:HAMP domain-containing histidine kinase [Ignavibacteriales bacterium]
MIKSGKSLFGYVIVVLVSIFLIHYLLMMKNNDEMQIINNWYMIMNSFYMTIMLFPILYILIWFDIKKRIKVEAELREAISAKDKLFSIIAHDLKSPLSGFIGLTGKMAEGNNSITHDEMEEFGIILHQSAKNLFELLENLLEWSKMQKGTVAYNPDECLLEGIVQHGMVIFAQSAEQKGITLINAIPDSVKILADKRMINLVLRNIISNAIKFTKRGGKIVIHSKKIGLSSVEISIEDNGIGMSESLRSKVFVVGEMVSRKGTEDESSSGLGLILCKEFVEKNGGHLWVLSEEGHGTIVKFTLPIIS